MSLNAKIGVFMDFWPFWAVRHIGRANCAEFTTDKSRQAAYEIFSVEHKCQRSKSRHSRFKETCTRWHQRAVPPKSRYFTVIGKFSVKTVADTHGYAAYHNKP